MVKDTSKKLKGKEAEKVKEVIVKKVIEPIIETPEPTIKEVKKLSEMPKEVSKPKTKKPKKLIQTGKESESDINQDSEFTKIATGKSLGIYAGVSIAIIIAIAGGYYAYTKLFKKNKDSKIDEKDIKALEGVKLIED